MHWRAGSAESIQLAALAGSKNVRDVTRLLSTTKEN